MFKEGDKAKASSTKNGLGESADEYPSPGADVVGVVGARRLSCKLSGLGSRFASH